MRPIVLVLLASVLLPSGCARRHAIPDPSIPHRVATEATVEVWVRNREGRMVRERVRILEGWWIASPQVVEGEP